MSAARATFQSEEARLASWLDTLHVLAQVHRARRLQVLASRRSPAHHILDARIACAVDGGTDPDAASGGVGDPDAAPVHPRAYAFRSRTLD